MRAIALTLFLFALESRGVGAQHDAHATADAKLGTVHFATSCRAEAAQEFDRGVALIHSFEFGVAIPTFQHVVALDSTCAMAHWGMALSYWSNPLAPGVRSVAQLDAGQKAIERGRRASTHATARERGYIDAVGQLYARYDSVSQRERVVAYERAMLQVAQNNPDDSEAQIFYALAMLASADPADKTYAKQLAAAATLERLYATHPDHPGLTHYLIHAYDAPPLASRGVDAARRYSAIAPDAAHALHMPSHIFTRVGSWDASIESNTRAIASAEAEGSMAEAMHASDYSEYAYLQTAQDRAARKILDGLPALVAKWDPKAIGTGAPPAAGFFALASIPARYALERRAWPEAAALRSTPSTIPWVQSATHFARALGAAHGGDLATARASLDTLGQLHDKLVAAGENYWAEQLAIQQLDVKGWLAHAEHRDEDALAALREASTREDATEKSVITPGPLIPARELLGDLLLELHQPAAALAEYRTTLAKEPNRFRALYGAMRAASLAGEKPAAKEYAARLREICAHGDADGRAELSEIRALR
ncbi:MAG TPA: hypothetical protein VK511_12625 [Gemmatimonadaceae bacterium]|nr:hypothetical protein [Gemmatimonadaceae bacterium]